VPLLSLSEKLLSSSESMDVGFGVAASPWIAGSIGGASGGASQ
jgi:hypothetical protein